VQKSSEGGGAGPSKAAKGLIPFAVNSGGAGSGPKERQEASIPTLSLYTTASRDRRNRAPESSDGGGAGPSKGAKGLNPFAVHRDRAGGGGASRFENACLGRYDGRYAAVGRCGVGFEGRFADDSNAG
jgi:hypothetical protein